jgi:hypothetical protein
MLSHRIERRPLLPPKGGTAATPSALGGTRSTASDGGTPSTASPLNAGSLCPGEMPRFPQRTSRPATGRLWSRLSAVGSVGVASTRDDQQALVHGKKEPGTAGQVTGAGRRHKPSGVRPGQWRRHSTAGAGGDGCSARRVVIRAGLVSKPLGPGRQTGRVRVALSDRTIGPWPDTRWGAASSQHLALGVAV